MHPVRRAAFALALASFGACGGTNDVGPIVLAPPPPGDDASIAADLDASVAPVDAGNDTGSDADDDADAVLYDRAVRVRPPPRDAGAGPDARTPRAEAGAPPEAGAPFDAAPATDGTAPPTEPTTVSILAAQSPDCLTIEADGGLGGCAAQNGCLDPAQQGGVCETVPGASHHVDPPVREAQLCLQTLQDVLMSTCSAGGELTPCLCGSTERTSCLAGLLPPTGPIYPDYVVDFGVDLHVITQNFTLSTFGAGQANSIAQCLQISNCPSCFGTPTNDAGKAAARP